MTIKGWRTIAFNVLAAVIPLLELTEVQAIIPREYLDFYMLGVALANIGLRYITTSPVGQGK